MCNHKKAKNISAYLIKLYIFGDSHNEKYIWQNSYEAITFRGFWQRDLWNSPICIICHCILKMLRFVFQHAHKRGSQQIK